MTRRTPPRDAFSRDIVEVESYVRDFSLRQRDCTVTALRFSNVLGPLLQTPFQALFTLPAVPSVLGFDPRLQLLHEEDAIEVRDKKAANFCDYFKPSARAYDSAEQTAEQAARSQLDSLFKK